ncbi:LolA family protein [Spirosoma sp. KUDC1026]|uniref:LolA family protein n=1 Tax=Spirosoma sp. KUDC1026 TaxID=2745947 RepID=UPI00159BA422|nr:DUF4292 domain-containing protein [Spirosoma sp. KUDC1026]QKZ13031.1 DUF4292 domain-containing protein [Spirosoma sp. KUDC1026]
MKRQFFTLLAIVALPALVFAQTADDIISKHVTALGGADKLAAIKTMQYDQTMSIQGMELTSKTVYVLGKSVRSDVSVMGQQITNVIDGDTGWMINPMQGGNAQDLPADAIKAAKGTTEPNMFQLAYLKANNYPYELVGKEKFKNKDVFNLKVTRPEGVFNYYLDTGTYQLVGTKGVINAQGQQVTTTSTYSNYKPVDGISVPYTSEMTIPSVPVPVTATVTNVAFNTTIDPAVFTKPK